MMTNQNSPSRYDKKHVQNSQFNSDLLGIAGDKVADLEIGSRGSTESKDTINATVRDVVIDVSASKELVKKFAAKRASTNLQ